MHNFDIYMESIQEELSNYSCYEEYPGSIYDLMERAYSAGYKAGYCAEYGEPKEYK